jgi:DNA-binding response OmpR family regulator
MTVRTVGQRFQLEVGDSGPGIPEDRRQAVFDRFERLDGDVTHRHGGTGLGLSIVRDFAALLGGTVSVGEALEGGALFVLDLPCAAPLGTTVRPVVGNTMPAYAADDVIDELRQARVTTPAPRAATGTAGRVLVVEDSQDMNRFIANCLTSDGFAVSAALDGVQGYEQASAERPDLVVTDIVMPRMRGDELIRRLRQRPDFGSTPILVLGAAGGDQFRVRPHRGDVQGYLDKPFSLDELRERVRDLVAQKRAGEQPATVPRRLDPAAAARYAILAAVSSVPEVNLQTAFQTIALEAQNLTAATYAALAIGGHVEHPFDVWAVTGLGAEERKTVGRHPGPVGLLGLVGKESKAIERRSSLGAPIRCDGYDIGHVYLASKRGAADFTDEDQRSIDALAERTGMAIHSARPYATDGPAWLQAVIEQMTDGVQLMDRDGHVTLANRSLRSIGHDGAAIADGSAIAADGSATAIAIDLCESSGARVAADDLPIARAIARQEITCRRELFARRHDGALLPLHVSAAPIFMSDGTCTGAAMVVREIAPLPQSGLVHSSWTPAAAPLPIGVISPRRSIARAQAADRSRPKNGGKSAPRRRG